MNGTLKQKLDEMELEVAAGRSDKTKGKAICSRLEPEIWRMIYLHMDRYNMTQTEALRDLIIDGFNFNAGSE